MWQCVCGQKLRSPSFPVRCRCGRAHEIDSAFATFYQEPNEDVLIDGQCMHFGSNIGSLSCGCGSLFRCNADGRMCALNSPPDKFVTGLVDGEELQLVPDNFRVCRGCADVSRVINFDLKERASKRTNGEKISVGFVAAAYCRIGGTETFHRTLLPRLQEPIEISGFVATAFAGGDPMLLGGVPYGLGMDRAKQLAEASDVLVCWGCDRIADIEPGSRPRVVLVHHGDAASDWSNDQACSLAHLWDAVVCVSAEAAELLRSRLPGRRIEHIPNAVDPARVCPSSPRDLVRWKYGIDPSTKVVLWAARMTEEKRPQAAIALSKILPDGWALVMAGDGPLSGHVMAAFSDKLIHAGRVDSLGDLLSISTVFLSTAVTEGFGLSMAEAMFARVPVAAYQVGVATESLASLISDVGAPESILGAVLEAAEGHKIDSAAMHASQHWSTELFSSRWQELLTEVYRSKR